MILTTHKVFVMVQAIWQTDFVAGGAEFRIFDDVRLEKRAFVHLRLGFDQSIVDPLQQLVIAKGVQVIPA